MALIAVTSPAHASAPAAQPIIIDTDIGDDIDDAFALAWAVGRPELRLLAVTTAWGDTALRTRMTRRLLAELGHPDVPVGTGTPTRSTTAFTQSAWARQAPADPVPRDAVDMMIELVRAHPREITLVALAPLTNIGAMIDRDPATFRQLKTVVLMGGSIRRGYNQQNGMSPNMVPSAEYNAAMDPASLRKLMGSGVPVTIFPLDSTQVKLEEIERARLFGSGSAMGDALTLLYSQWRLNNPFGQVTPTLFDAVPIAFLLDPSLCPTAPIGFTVENDGHTRETAPVPNIRACLMSEDGRIARQLTNDVLSVRQR